MKLSNFQRLLLLAKDLLTKPKYLIPYLKNVPKKSPLDIELPWFSFEAISFLESYLRKEMTVFEFGTGGSTMFFARRCESIKSVEDDIGWCERVKQALETHGLRNVSLKTVPFDFTRSGEFEKSSYALAMGKDAFDVIVIDGQEDVNSTCRPKCFYIAQRHIKPGGIIVVDDSWRYMQLRSSHSAKKRLTFQSTGPCRVGVTSTDIYFY